MTLTPEQEAAQRAFAEACKPSPIAAVEEAGILLGVSADDYHRRELHVVSKSALDQIDRSPAHYLAWLYGQEAEPTPDLRFGTAFHMALLEPLRFQARYVTPPKFSGKGAVKARESWFHDRPGAVALSEDDREVIAGMIRSVKAHPAGSRLISEGVPEVTLRWVDGITGLRCKARADYWVKAKRLCVDVKSTRDASPEKFSKDVYNYGYHKQDALYRAGFLACESPIDHFAILAVEKEPPYAVAVYTLDGDAVAKGFHAARQGIERLADCVRNEDWPGYDPGVCELSLPHWAV